VRYLSATATREVPENTEAGENIGAPVTAADPDTGDTLTYTLGGADADSFDIGRSTGQITVGTGTTLDYGASRDGAGLRGTGQLHRQRYGR
jgi:hypothetical protein